MVLKSVIKESLIEKTTGQRHEDIWKKTDFCVGPREKGLSQWD